MEATIGEEPTSGGEVRRRRGRRRPAKTAGRGWPVRSEAERPRAALMWRRREEGRPRARPRGGEGRSRAAAWRRAGCLRVGKNACEKIVAREEDEGKFKGPWESL